MSAGTANKATRPRHTFGGNQALSPHHPRPTSEGGTTSGEARKEVNPLPKLTCAEAYAAGPATALRGREEGQTMAEYTVGLSVITVVVITAISLLSDHVLNTITGVANVLPGP